MENENISPVMETNVEKKSGLATAGLVLSIVGVCTSFLPIINNLSFCMGLIAIIFGIISLCKKASKGKAIAGIIIGILAIVFTVSAQKALADSFNKAFDDFNTSMDTVLGDNTEKVLAEYLDVELGEFKIDKSSYITNTELPIRLTNKSKETKSFSVKIEAVAQNGDRITTDTVYASDLNAGQSQNLKAFYFITSDEQEQLKKATFNILEASAY